jgi:uncharacterized protein
MIARLVASLIVFETLMIFVHLAVYATLTAAFGGGGIVLEVVFIVLALTFVSASLLAHFYKGLLVDTYYVFAVYWLGLVNFLFCGAVVFYFTLKIFYGMNIYVSPALVGAISFGIFFLLHLYGTWNSQHVQVTNVQVALSKTAQGFRADFWKGKKVVFVSDFQLGNVYKESFTAKVVKKIKAIDPYLILIGGDLYDGVVSDEEKLIAPLHELHADGGIYFITGNHEYYLRDVSRGLAAVRSAGITVLDDKKIDVGGIDIIGVDYQSAHKKDNFKKTLAKIGVDRTKPSILLKHEPIDLDVAETAGISLDLSGHTHHGQMFPLSLFTWQIYKGLDYGLKRLGAMQVFTSSGVGTWGPPLRLGTKAEIVVLEFV